MQKSFKNDNPALAFISIKDEKPAQQSSEKAPDGYRVDPRYIEVKSKRFGLLLQPSVWESLKKMALNQQTSVNELVNQAIKQYLVQNDNSFEG